MEGDYLPLCQREHGCHIEDLAADTEITEAIDLFETAKALQKVGESDLAAARVFRRLGLFDDPHYHLRMEYLYFQKTQKK
jgi:hypothetical protein